MLDNLDQLALAGNVGVSMNEAMESLSPQTQCSKQILLL